MRVLGQMVVRNEADRYLDCSLSWHLPILDGLHVYDDRSTDDSVDLATSHGAVVTTRDPDVPSFVQHEGQFRQAAWRAFEAAMMPEAGDWVLAIDADEFLVSRAHEADSLWSAVNEALQNGWVARMVRIPEVFAVSNEHGELTQPQVRMDGYWGGIQGTRLFSYQPHGQFSNKPMGSGSEPTYVAGNGPWGPPTDDLFLLHYGYAFTADQQAKYARYSQLVHGHSNAHVESIITEPTLVRWDGPMIDVWQGRRC